MSFASQPDLLGPEAIADPYAVFGTLREEDPVHYSEAHRCWVITRYEDVADAFTDPRLSSDRVDAVYATKLTEAERTRRAPTYAVLSDWMVFKDPPDHTRLRDLVRRAFTPRAVAALEPRIAEVVEHVLDLPEQGEIDVIDEIAYPIPAMVIAEMLGVPPDDRHLFRAWSNDITTLIFQGTRTDADRDRAQGGLVALSEYLHGLLAEQRRAPGENLMAALLAARARDDSLSEDEIVNTCVLLLFGGHETTTNLIANGFLALLRNPEQAHRLLDEPGLATSAVEELNRYDGPAKMVVRRAAVDHERAGRRIEAGQRVLLVQCSANRDPRRFEEPDRLDLGRADQRNVAFGFGPHYCLGAPLARLEVQIALPAMLRRLRGAKPAGELRYQPMLLTRGLVDFPLRYGG
ncbi:MAG: cytochrome P450 [Solirubrobacterales bacterium]|nr:cytochrome P450 [Solirubrobacterales bacterium]